MVVIISVVNRRQACVMCGGLTGALLLPVRLQAHALPGASITVAVGQGGVDMRITLAVHDLALAVPEAGLEADGLSAGQIGQLMAYFSAHVRLKVADGAPLRLADMTFGLDIAANDDVGEYQVLLVDVQFDWPTDAAPDMLQLDYDAVIHMVRNHKASIEMRQPDGEMIFLGLIAYDFALKTVPPVRFATRY
jgi:hypothetical protein